VVFLQELNRDARSTKQNSATFSYFFIIPLDLTSYSSKSACVIHALLSEQLSTAKCFVLVGYCMNAALAMTSPVALHG
jgi:hypothetical protein